MAQPAYQFDPESECTLKDILDPSTGTLPFAACAFVLAEVCKQLLIEAPHGEVIPQNIRIGPDGSVRLIDAGTSEADLSDNLAYLAPERIRGKKAESRSDLFSLAGIFTEALTGIPFQSAKLINQTAKNPMSLVDPDVPTALVPLIRRALALNPEERFGSVAEMYGLMKPLLSQPVLDEGKRLLASSAAKRSPAAPQSSYTPNLPAGDEISESRSYNPAPPEPEWEKTQAGAPTLTTRREQVRTKTEMGYRQRRVSGPVKKRWVVAGMLTIAAGAWLVSFLNFIAPLSESPSERVDTRHNSPVYEVPGAGRRCLVELDTSPSGVQVRVNRFWSGGLTPTTLSIPCGENALVTLKAADGTMTHQFVRPIELQERRKYRISKAYQARLAAWLRLVIAFHTDFLAKK